MVREKGNGEKKGLLMNFYNLYCDYKVVVPRKKSLKVFLSKEYTKDAVPVNEEVKELKLLQQSYYDYIKGNDREFSFFSKDVLFDKTKRGELSDLEIYRNKDDIFIPQKVIEETKKKVKLTDAFKDEQLNRYYYPIEKNMIKNISDYSDVIDEKIQNANNDNYVLISKKSIRNQILSLDELINQKEKKIIKEESKIQNNFNKAKYLSNNYLFLKDRLSE
jgi:hypothetical protein